MPDDHEIRQLRWKVRQLSKQAGRQGETIHRLRGELAEVRRLHSRIDRGELYRLDRRVMEYKAEITRLRDRLQSPADTEGDYWQAIYADGSRVERQYVISRPTNTEDH